MKRINVIGSSGSGKSTFAKALAQKLDVTHIEMDKLFWKAGWRESTDHEFFSNLKMALTQSEWVLDGNYSRTESIKWQDVDTIIWLDYSRTVTFYRAIKRALTRIYTKQEVWEGTGNRESLYRLLTKDSIVLWSIKNYAKRRQKYLQLKRELSGSPIQFVHLTNPKKAQAYLEKL
ncbi:TPA: adenylate kinase [Vibrio parahaemolyticus]|nr:adenylate kinase [Vibrio parahaemolyticus]